MKELDANSPFVSWTRKPLTEVILAKNQSPESNPTSRVAAPGPENRWKLEVSMEALSEVWNIKGKVFYSIFKAENLMHTAQYCYWDSESTSPALVPVEVVRTERKETLVLDSAMKFDGACSSISSTLNVGCSKYLLPLHKCNREAQLNLNPHFFISAVNRTRDIWHHTIHWPAVERYTVRWWVCSVVRWVSRKVAF